ncbi:ABC transporter substrate-binding protein [Gracilibacillus caseinilyticus]|uniref:ABC transporter substrate-binding protein n=1 Tax=Gracilibacillus caseinilyticus TaxID=2932256 RepID=A0ABY4EWJ3_9BACI|nr:ABC transporter substrate-binding protein [Gracilibacillus caseinilyticus]UOQ48649.1 ABC transporter substrate-binding protein [Gracilibacillus caseinilyticus]
MGDRKRINGFALIICGMMVFLLIACSEEGSSKTTSGEEGTDSVKLILNWFTKAQHGGIYAAEEQGVFSENELDVSIQQGGSQVSPIQLVSSGTAEFGLAHADQLVTARNEGIELVAVAATMQGSPQALMFHKGKGVKDFNEMNGRKVFIQPGIVYWDYLQNNYELSEVEELAYSGQHSNFINDPDSVSQAFVTSEPFFLKQEGIKTQTKLISDSGYDPYNIVLFVTKDYLEENKEIVQRMVTSFVKGWNYYKESPDEITEVIHNETEDLSLEALQFEQESQEEFVFGSDAAEHGVGYMTEERWSTLIDQLYELELLDEKFDANDIFTTEFLPE